MKNWTITALVAVIAVGGTYAALAATYETTTTVEVVVWQRVEDGSLFLSTRSGGGPWVTHENALDMNRLSSTGRYRQSTPVALAVPVAVQVPDEPDSFVPVPGPFEGRGTGYLTDRAGPGGSIRTYVYMAGDSSLPGARVTSLSVRCIGGELAVHLAGRGVPAGEPGDVQTVAWGSLDEPAEPDAWSLGANPNTLVASNPDAV